ncbi:MAG: hypothetical protein VW646_01815 [Hydrogenophilales bacterium]
MNVSITRHFFNNKTNFILSITKIAIIIFSAYSITANILPFYEGSNSFYYSTNAVLFGNGQFSITNELLQETGRSEFVPENWLLTVHDTAVPMSGTGLMAVGSMFYLLGGYYGLLYLSPIFFIILIIVSERISTALFGKYVGLITLLIVASSNLLFRNSVILQTESIFALITIIGVFYLIKFLKTRNNNYLILSNIILTLSVWVRLNGLIAFPLEIFIVSIYLIYTCLIKNKKWENGKRNNFKKYNRYRINKKTILKISLILIIPWSCFFISYLVYYDYNFGNPVNNYGEINESTDNNYDTSLSSIMKFEHKDYENIKQYSKYVLPYQIAATYNNAEENFENILGKNWIGLISIGSLFLITAISFYTKDKRIEIFVLMMFIVCAIWFFSSITSENRAEGGVPGRYMLSSFILGSMIFGYFIQKIFSIEKKEKSILKNQMKVLKGILILILGIFFIFAFYFSNPVQIIIEEGWKFKNPEEIIDRYPLSLEGLTNDSVVVTMNGVRALEYGVISFDPISERQVSSDSVNLLKKIIKKGHDVYTFKIPFIEFEKNIYNNLINEHGFILKEHSKTFCKVELSSSENPESDLSCMNNEPIRKTQK